MEGNCAVQVIEGRKRILGVEHQDTILSMANLASTYTLMGEYTEAEKLQIQVLNACKRIFGVEHPHTIQAMKNLAAILQSLRKDKEPFKLVIQAQNVKSRVIGAKSHYASASMANVQEARETSMMNFDKKGVYSKLIILLNQLSHLYD